jgi:PAS domain S-box-containing protein
LTGIVMPPPDVDSLVHDTLLAEATSNSGHALLLAEEAGRIVAVNDAACRLLGFTRHELVGVELVTLAPTLSDLQMLTRRRTVRRVVPWVLSDGTLVEAQTWLSDTKVGSLPFLLIVTEPQGTCSFDEEHRRDD